MKTLNEFNLRTITIIQVVIALIVSLLFQIVIPKQIKKFLKSRANDLLQIRNYYYNYD
jgi:hypothetical protein